MCMEYAWHKVDQGERKCLPDCARRVLVAQDDGYIEMAYWDGSVFEFDHEQAPVPRVLHWCPLPDWPQERREAHTILVAFVVNARSHEDAQRLLMERLPDPESDNHSVIDCWWIAEKERFDGSDGPSAEFI